MWASDGGQRHSSRRDSFGGMRDVYRVNGFVGFVECDDRSFPFEGKG